MSIPEKKSTATKMIKDDNENGCVGLCRCMNMSAKFEYVGSACRKCVGVWGCMSGDGPC